MSHNSLKVDTAREFRTEYGMDMPTLKLARIMYNKNKLLFKDLEEARNKLRYIEGKQGGKRLAGMGKSAGDFVMAENRPKNPYNLPASEDKELLTKRISVTVSNLKGNHILGAKMVGKKGLYFIK